MNYLFQDITKIIIRSTRFICYLCLFGLTATHCQGGDAVRLQNLPGWEDDNFQQAWESWQLSCKAFYKTHQVSWIKICNKARQINAGDSKQQKQFFESNFQAYPIYNSDGSAQGTITGYYEPLLQGSLIADNEYRYPVYSKPSNLTHLSMTRAQIELQADKIKENIILWTNNPYDLFFLQIQGSGRVEFKSGLRKSLVYSGNNGHKYTSIGKLLLERGELQKAQISMQSLKKWLINHPKRAAEVMRKNKRYIFFNLSEIPKGKFGPHGSFNVPLTPSRSIAIDPLQIQMGSPVWLDTKLPQQNNDPQPFRRLMFAQDAGAAIKGRVRADIFFGTGNKAEYLAGHMKQRGKMYVLKPR